MRLAIASGFDFAFVAALAYATCCAGCANAAPAGERVNGRPQFVHPNDCPAIAADCSGVTA